MAALTVKELKSIIKKLPDNMQVVIQEDSEGNGYRLAAGADPNCIYIPESGWQGEVHSMSNTADDMEMTESEWEDMKKENKKVLVIHPIN